LYNGGSFLYRKNSIAASTVTIRINAGAVEGLNFIAAQSAGQLFAFSDSSQILLPQIATILHLFEMQL
jgi:hypothetical protein